MRKVGDINITSQLENPVAYEAATAASAQKPSLSPAQIAESIRRLTQQSSIEPQTSTLPLNSLMLKSVSELPSFQSFNFDTKDLILKLISNADLTELNEQKALNPNVVESAIANVTRLLESAGFKKLSPVVQKELLSALFRQADSNFLADNLTEITGTNDFQSLDQHSQKIVVEQIGVVVASKATQNEAQVTIDNIRALIGLDEIKKTAPVVRAKMLGTAGLTGWDTGFINALTRISGDSERFGRLSESQKFTFIDRLKKLFDERWMSRSLIAPTHEIVIAPVHQKIKEILGERWANKLPGHPIDNIIEGINEQIDKTLGRK